MAAYFGLVLRQYQSGETDRNGRITKRGNPLARTILVECAWASLRYNPWAKGVYEQLAALDPLGIDAALELLLSSALSTAR